LTDYATPRPDDPQAAAIRTMTDPALHGGLAVEQIETHISHIFLAGDLAYKMKKAVKLAFVDFSTVDRRREACLAELAVNARTAPDIYLDVVALNREDDGRLTLGPPARPVDYLVRMRRFDEDALLDRMAARGALDDRLARALADAVADLHLKAERITDGAGTEDFATTVRLLSERLGAAEKAPETAERARNWQGRATALVAGLEPLLSARARHGAVRHGHGDLHLRNICVFEGRVRLFDAIEFEPRFSHVDILYDFAFLQMDLMHRGQERIAALVESRYLTATRDYSGLRLLPLFVSVRAAVRALVAMLSPDDGRDAEAGVYLDLALSVLDARPPPRLIAIGGRSGTGKSTVALALARRLPWGAVVIRSDEVRKRLLGAAPETPLGAEAYRPDVSDRVYRRMLGDARRALDAGATVILDATFLSDSGRAAARSLGEASGVPLTGVWLAADDTVLRARLVGRTHDASDADVAVLRNQTEPRDLGDWQCLDANADADAGAARIADGLARSAAPDS
jgi:aminoglycoside phosphotransferase family enzyme/predicted kinase